MSTTLDRKFLVDVTSDLTLAGSWIRVNGVSSFAPQVTPNIADTTASDTSGQSTSEVTLYDTTADLTFFRRIVSSVYDPGQELIRARILQFGSSARLGMRWYDAAAGPETGMGIFLVSWKRTNSGVRNVEQADVTLTATDIAVTLNFSNPYSTTQVPVITGASPSGAAVSTILSITGVNFTGTVGASHVTIGGTNATSYIVQSDTLITALMPAGSAGSAPIIVTNTNGASAAFPYTRT